MRVKRGDLLCGKTGVQSCGTVVDVPVSRRPVRFLRGHVGGAYPNVLTPASACPFDFAVVVEAQNALTAEVLKECDTRDKFRCVVQHCESCYKAGASGNRTGNVALLL